MNSGAILLDKVMLALSCLYFTVFSKCWRFIWSSPSLRYQFLITLLYCNACVTFLLQKPHFIALLCKTFCCNYGGSLDSVFRRAQPLTGVRPLQTVGFLKKSKILGSKYFLNIHSKLLKQYQRNWCHWCHCNSLQQYQCKLCHKRPQRMNTQRDHKEHQRDHSREHSERILENTIESTLASTQRALPENSREHARKHSREH